jgi:hypothetical protein
LCQCEGQYTHGGDVIGWWESNPTAETLLKEHIVRQFDTANTGTLAGTDLEWDTTNTENNLQMMKELEERILHRMAKVHVFLEI